jgi:hypothetical protein
MRLSVSSTPSNTPSNTPSVTPSNTSCPNFTPSATPTLTPTLTLTPTELPTIYLHTCLPDVVPADGRVYICAYATSESGCTGATTSVLNTISFTDDIGIIVDGEYVNFVSMNGCVYLYPGQSCNCDCYYDFGAELSGYTMSALTFPIFVSGTPLANYVDDGECYTPECSQCIPTPTPTLTTTPTLTATPTLTSTPTLTPTTSAPPCDAADYLLFNETGSPLSWTGIDCNGNGVGDTIPGGQQANTGCIQVGSLVEGSLTIVSTTPC